MATISKKFRIGESSTYNYEDVSVFPSTLNFKEVSMVEMDNLTDKFLVSFAENIQFQCMNYQCDFEVIHNAKDGYLQLAHTCPKCNSELKRRLPEKEYSQTLWFDIFDIKEFMSYFPEQAKKKIFMKIYGMMTKSLQDDIKKEINK